MDTFYRVSHYESNMAALLQLGQYFDYLREMGVYDNTRIIIVADHGNSMGGVGQFNYLKISSDLDAQRYNPLLMVKDFGSKEYTASDEFMTNADVPVLVFDELVENPVNPFTGNAVTNDAKYEGAQLINTSRHYHIFADHPNKKTFNLSDGQWWSVSGNIFKKKNWKKENEAK